jgi:hypothetical protein
MAETRGTIGLRAVLLWAAALGCSDDPERPPPYVGTPPGNLRSCAELRQGGELVGSEFSIDGARANCAANGLKCPVEQTPAITARCEGGLGQASCSGEIWTLMCVTAADSGAADAP